jgi:hypothetical protein
MSRDRCKRCLETSHGGAEGIRTPDPLDANEVRYQAAPQPQNGRRQVITRRPSHISVADSAPPREDHVELVVLDLNDRTRSWRAR